MSMSSRVLLMSDVIRKVVASLYCQSGNFGAITRRLTIGEFTIGVAGFFGKVETETALVVVVVVAVAVLAAFVVVVDVVEVEVVAAVDGLDCGMMIFRLMKLFFFVVAGGGTFVDANKPVEF